jgi:hypothetical protein
MASVPFAASSHLWDRFDVAGVLFLTATGLMVEYQGEWVRYDDAGEPFEKTEWDATSFEIPFEAIVSIEFRRRLLRRPLVVLQVHSLGDMQDFPLAEGVEADVPIHRSHARAAALLVVEAQAAMAEAALRLADAGEPGTLERG